MIDIGWYEQNLEGFILDLKKQLAACIEVIEQPDSTKVQKIDRKDHHLNNLKRMIEQRCMMDLAKNVLEDKKFIQFIMGINSVASSLEKIGDYTVSIAHQTLYLADRTYFKDHYNYPLFFEIIEKGLDKVHHALFHQDIETGVLICKSEVLLDYIYEEKLKEIIASLQAQESHASNLVTSLFIYHYLERMGDTLQNIGESIVSAAMGENLKIDQVNSLKVTLGLDYYKELQSHDVKFRSIWGTRSGCRIGEVNGDLDSTVGERESIFKDGDHDKLIKEKEKIDFWNEKFPGTAPKVLGFEENTSYATLLLEKINGQNIKETILNADEETLTQMLPVYEEKLKEVWTQTLKTEPIAGHYMNQLKKRLDDVFFAHSEFKTKTFRFGEIENLSFTKAIKELSELEEDVKAPFSVLLHGDSNIDNIIYNNAKKTIHFIDLHRSISGDYVQDVSVYLVSCFRLPLFNEKVRSLINKTIERHYQFAHAFAQEHKDKTFQLRLAYGLIRSFTTSTRFELNKSFAKEMYLRSSYLINHILNHAGAPEDVDVPLDLLLYEK